MLSIPAFKIRLIPAIAFLAILCVASPLSALTHIALLEPEYITPDAQASRRELTAWLDTILTDALAQQKDFTIVDRQLLAKVLAEKELAKLNPQTADTALKPFIASGVLICPTIVADPKTNNAVITVQAVLAQRGTLLAEIVAVGDLAPDGWKTLPDLSKTIAPFFADLRAQLAANLGHPGLEISRITLAGKLDRLQWLADDLTDSLAATSYDGLVLLVPRQPVHTKEERLLRLMGLTAPANRSAKLCAASDYQFTGDLSEEPKPNTPFDQTPITLAVRLTSAGKALASTDLIATVGTAAKLRQDACTWSARQVAQALHAPAPVLDESHATALAKLQLATAQRLIAISYGTSSLETARLERLATAALAACHLDPTSEEAAFLAATTIEGLYNSRAQSQTLACKDRILQLGQQYVDRFGDKDTNHHREVLTRIGSAGHSAAWLLHGKPGGTSAITSPPDERQYPYTHAYVRAWMELGIRSKEDYQSNNALSAAADHLRLHLIPNTPDDQLDKEYAFWRDTWAKRITPLAAAKYQPWECIDLAFQARRKDPAAVRALLQKLANKFRATESPIWRLQADDLVSLYLRAAGDKEADTWRPTWPASAELAITREEGLRFYARSHIDPPQVWDLSQSTPLPFDTRLTFDPKVLETGRQRFVCPYPKIQPLFAVAGDLFFITPGLWNTINLDQSHSLFVSPLSDLTHPDREIHADVRPLPWPNLPDTNAAPTAQSRIKILCWLRDPMGKTIYIGTAGHGLAKFTKDQATWQGHWLTQHDGLPAGAITSLSWEKEPALLRIQGAGSKTRWAIRYDTTRSATELLPEPAPSQDPLRDYERLTTTLPGDPTSSRHWALQACRNNGKDHWELGELDPLTHKFLPGMPLLGTLTDNATTQAYLRGEPGFRDLPFLPPSAPLHETRLAAPVADSLLLASFFLTCTQNSPNNGEASHLAFYRPAPANAPHPTAVDQWIGPFLSPDRSLIFAVLNDGAGNLWLTTDQFIYRISESTFFAKLPVGQSTDAYRATIQAQRKKADWRTRVHQSLAENNPKDALAIVDDILSPLAGTSATSTPELRDDWAVATLYRTKILATQDKTLNDSIDLTRQIFDTPWANPAARQEAAASLLDRLSRAHRWQDILDAAETIRPLFPKLVDESDPTSERWYIENSRAQLKRTPAPKH